MNIVWLKPNKANTKYHAFLIDTDEGNKKYTMITMCNNHGFVYPNNRKGYDEFAERFDTLKHLGITEHDLIENFPQHCCKKCLTSYKFRKRLK